MILQMVRDGPSGTEHHQLMYEDRELLMEEGI
jgi:hypothetical protein